MSSKYGNSRTLEFTPTWALATVTTIFVVISFVVERCLHSLGHHLRKRKRKAMYHAFEKMKDELMLVGFISLSLAILQEPISSICIKSSYFKKWSPCKMPGAAAVNGTSQKFQMPRPSDFSFAVEQHTRRRLLAATTSSVCDEGYESFATYSSLHQLHIFIFVLATTHVLYTFTTLVLAFLKVYTWKKWENKARDSISPNRMAELVVNNISYTRQSTFMRYHTSKPWSRSRVVVWVVCFFQQFHIPRADYLTLRFSFITTHNLPLQYNFHDYMLQSMEDEFESIVGISWWLWIFVIIFMIVNVQGVNIYFWTSFTPFMVILAIGTKLQHVVATLAMESNGSLPLPGPFVGAQLKPRDELFWFKSPKILHYIIHLVLFQDALEMSTFIWQVWQFGFDSCLMDENKGFAYTRLILGLVIQIFVSFSTVPLYALVSQMGSSYKKAVIAPRVNRALRVWHNDAKKRLKHGDGESSHHKLIDEDLVLSDFDNIGLSSPMTVAMEEGVEKRKTNVQGVSEDSEPSHPSAALAAQNMWERRLRQTGESSKSKTLQPIQRQQQGSGRSRFQPGPSPGGTPGSALRQRTSPVDTPMDTPVESPADTTLRRPPKSSRTPKPSMP